MEVRQASARRTGRAAMSAPTEPALSAATMRNRARRDQILSAAAKCFVENGFHGSSMAELAKRAGMSVGHIYHYFDSKDAIIEAIVDKDIEEAPGILDDFSGAEGGGAGMMDRPDETVERHLDRDRAALRLEILAEAARNPRIAAKVHSADAIARNRLIQALPG